MGFDGFNNIEFVMSLEDELEISIPDRDAERLKTPGDVLEYLSARVAIVPFPGGAVCRSARRFYKSRRLLADWANIPMDVIRPSMPIERFLPSSSDSAGCGGGRQHPKFLPVMKQSEPLSGNLDFINFKISPGSSLATGPGTNFGS